MSNKEILTIIKKETKRVDKDFNEFEKHSRKFDEKIKKIISVL